MAKKKQKAAKKSASRVSMAIVPAARGAKVGGAKPPTITNHPDGSCVITHTEFVQDVASGGAGGGAVLYLPVNPQRASVFTWLAAIATRFEMYRFEKLKFMYRPSLGTSQSGWVVLAFDFDAYDNPTTQTNEANYPSKSEMLTWKYSSKSAVWQDCSLDLSADSRISTYRYCDISSRGDLRLDLLGNMFVRALTLGDTLACGELFVEYTVRFRQPSYKIPPALYSQVGDGNWVWPAPNFWFPVGTPVAGNMAVQRVSNNQLLINDVGQFLLSVAMAASGSIAGSPTVTYSVPPTSPSANWEDTLLSSYHSFTGAGLLSYLRVETPPVLATFTQPSGSDLSAILRFATFKQS